MRISVLVADKIIMLGDEAIPVSVELPGIRALHSDGMETRIEWEDVTRQSTVVKDADYIKPYIEIARRAKKKLKKKDDTPPIIYKTNEQIQLLWEFALTGNNKKIKAKQKEWDEGNGDKTNSPGGDSPPNT